MPRLKRDHKQQRFDLYPDNSDEAELSAFLDDLGKRGQQRDWIVRALLTAMKQEKYAPKVITKRSF